MPADEPLSSGLAPCGSRPIQPSNPYSASRFDSRYRRSFAASGSPSVLWEGIPYQLPLVGPGSITSA
jgi:hypothetical protein